MSKLEKKIILVAIIFVAVYLGAIVLTLQSRRAAYEKTTRIESAVAVPEEEAPLMLAELLLPMAVLSTLAICFILAKRRRIRLYRKLDDTDDDLQKGHP
jgi:hypothetical protein